MVSAVFMDADLVGPLSTALKGWFKSCSPLQMSRIRRGVPKVRKIPLKMGALCRLFRSALPVGVLKSETGSLSCTTSGCLIHFLIYLLRFLGGRRGVTWVLVNSAV